MGNEKEINKYDDYKRILRINDSIGLEKKHEVIEEFNESFFRDNYYTAFALTRKVLERGQKMKEERKGERDWNTGQEKLYNIITFCGERGSGKTSVMDSIVKVLCGSSNSGNYRKFVETYGQNEKEEEELKKSRLKGLLDTYEFICMDMIDASLLEEKEEILDVILSKMYQKVRMNARRFSKCSLWEMEQGNACSKEDIYRKFEMICQNKLQFQRRMDKKYETGESSIEKLGNLAGSMNIREKMQDLISAYLDLLCENKNKRKCLVISIDDLDMHGNAYGMLEQLHRYLMIPEVVIYLTVSEREIQSVCKKHFEQFYESSDELAMSYLEKVLPYSRRIYLPATFSGDFFNVVAGEDSNMDGYPVKRFLLREIMRKTGVFYDGCGGETHFYEIENLRTLINTYYLLDGMEEYGAEKRLEQGKKILKDHLKTLDLNFEKLRSNVVGRMAAQKLNSPRQREIFRKYYKEDFSSNGEYLVREIAKIMDDDVPDYNYGELLGSLDALGKKCQEFKPLIQCVLALATIELTQNYIYAFMQEDRNSQKKWGEYISGSVIGSWGNQMLPKIEAEGGKFAEAAYIRGGKICISVPVDIQEAVLGNLKESISLEERRQICEWLINEKRIVETMILVMSFFIEKPDVFLKESEKPNEALLELSGEKYTFDLLGFAINSMHYEEFTGEIAEKLAEAMGAYIYSGHSPEYMDEKDKIKKELKQKIQSCPIMADYKVWDEKHIGAALPIYSLDIMYHILKRTKKKMKKRFPREIGKEKFLPAVQSFYVFLGDFLTEEDMFYGQRDETQTENVNIIKMKNQYTDFYGAFLENPFIKYFVKEKEREEDQEALLLSETGKDQEAGQKTIEIEPGPTEEQTDLLPALFHALFEKLLDQLLNKQISR